MGEKGARWLLSSDGQTLAPLVGDWSRSLDCACAAAAVHDAMRVATRLKSETKKSEQHTRQLDRIHEHRLELRPSAGDVAELSNLMLSRSTYLPLDTKYSRKDIKLHGPIGHTPGENPKIHIFSSGSQMREESLHRY